MTTGEKFEKAVGIMARLRAPGGCPWDREQTFDTIKPYTMEETYEVMEAIENRDFDELPGELGDLLLQVLFYAEMANEEKRFSIDDVLDRLAHKLISRHPHVFGETQAETPAEVLKNWEAIKQQERVAKATHSATLLGNVSSKMPALMEAAKISSKAAGVGFDWPNVEGLFEKLTEETNELRRELEALPHPPSPKARSKAIPLEVQQRLEGEVGDLFFVLVNIARYLDVDAESALRRTNRKFRTRFQQVEESLASQGKPLGEATLDEMESAWQLAKVKEGNS